MLTAQESDHTTTAKFMWESIGSGAEAIAAVDKGETLWRIYEAIMRIDEWLCLRFCSRCSLPLDGVIQLLSSGGMLPTYWSPDEPQNYDDSSTVRSRFGFVYRALFLKPDKAHQRLPSHRMWWEHLSIPKISSGV